LARMLPSRSPLRYNAPVFGIKVSLILVVAAKATCSGLSLVERPPAS
jgi:hypothetical protein